MRFWRTGVYFLHLCGLKFMAHVVPTNIHRRVSGKVHQFLWLLSQSQIQNIHYHLKNFHFTYYLQFMFTCLAEYLNNSWHWNISVFLCQRAVYSFFKGIFHLMASWEKRAHVQFSQGSHLFFSLCKVWLDASESLCCHHLPKSFFLTSAIEEE